MYVTANGLFTSPMEIFPVKTFGRHQNYYINFGVIERR